ncbi:hypothetical protein P405_20720 [Streptomyces sp. FR-008]|nr:hypothetical protein P405_20720 [Streptomyces sp. FR-008]
MTTGPASSVRAVQRLSSPAIARTGEHGSAARPSQAAQAGKCRAAAWKTAGSRSAPRVGSPVETTMLTAKVSLSEGKTPASANGADDPVFTRPGSRGPSGPSRYQRHR